MHMLVFALVLMILAAMILCIAHGVRDAVKALRTGRPAKQALLALRPPA